MKTKAKREKEMVEKRTRMARQFDKIIGYPVGNGNIISKELGSPKIGQNVDTDGNAIKIPDPGSFGAVTEWPEELTKMGFPLEDIAKALDALKEVKNPHGLREREKWGLLVKWKCDLGNWNLRGEDATTWAMDEEEAMQNFAMMVRDAMMLNIDYDREKMGPCSLVVDYPAPRLSGFCDSDCFYLAVYGKKAFCLLCGDFEVKSGRCLW